MKALPNTLLTISVILMLGTSHAEVKVEIPANFRPTESTLTRAEVVADLLIWRAAGLSALHNRQQGPDTFSEEYKLAHTRYSYLRSSPQLAELVERIKLDGAHIRLVEKNN